MLVALHGNDITWQNLLKLKASVIRYAENLHPIMNLIKHVLLQFAKMCSKITFIYLRCVKSAFARWITLI